MYTSSIHSMGEVAMGEMRRFSTKLKSVAVKMASCDSPSIELATSSLACEVRLKKQD